MAAASKVHSGQSSTLLGLKLSTLVASRRSAPVGEDQM
jgi:hypothetical protein